MIVRWIKRCIIKSYDPCRSGSMDCAFELAYYEIWFDKKILEDPNTFSSSSSQITKNLEFGQKEWLLRLESLQTFDESDKKTKEKRKREFNIVMSGQFLAMFFTKSSFSPTVWYLHYNHDCLTIIAKTETQHKDLAYFTKLRSDLRQMYSNIQIQFAITLSYSLFSASPFYVLEPEEKLQIFISISIS